MYVKYDILSRSKTNFTFFWIILFFINTGFAQQTFYKQEEIDTFQIKPLNAENLDAYKHILLNQPELKGWVKYYSKYSYFKLFQKQEDSTLLYGQKSIEFYENSFPKREMDESELCRVYFAIGRAYILKKDYERSLQNLLKAKELSIKFPNRLLGYINSGIAFNQLSLGNDSLAIEYYQKATKDSLFSTNPRSQITALMRIGALYGPYHLNRGDSSKVYLYQARKLAIQSGQKNNLGATYNNLGDVFKEEGLVDSAVHYYRQAHETLNEHQPITKEGKLKTNLFRIANYAYVKIYSGQVDEAIEDLNELRRDLDTITAFNKNDKGLFTATYNNLVYAYQEKGDLDKISEVVTLKDEFLEKFHKTELKMQLERLQLAYETKEKESEIERLEILNRDQETIKNQQRIIFFVLALLLIAALGGLWFYFRQRAFRNDYKQVVLQQQLLRTQLNPHFLFNSLNTAVILSKKEPQTVGNYLQELGTLMRTMLTNSRKEFVPLQQEINALEAYLELQSDFSQKFTFEISADSELDTQYIQIPPMLIQPFVENAIIHGLGPVEENGQIKISFYVQDKNSILCEIEDNGVGFEVPTKSEITNFNNHTSLSLKIIRERLKVYSKKLKVDTSVNLFSHQDNRKGTLVQLVLPIVID